MDDLNEAMLAKGEAYILKQNEEYERALAQIRLRTAGWYARLAANNNISLAEARKLLNKNELREFKWTVDDYIKAGRENAVDQRWMKELENASAKVHITRLQELETHLRNEVEQLTAKRLKGATDTLSDVYKDSYYRSAFELQKGAGVGTSLAMLDDRQIDKVLAKPWAPDGSNFSARIWGDRTKLINELQTSLTQSLIRGESLDQVISSFADRMGVSQQAAARLIRTESAYFSGQSRLDAYRETGVEEYKYVAILDKRTSEICQEMDGRVFRLSEAKAGVNYPPLHVYCRSTTIPHYGDAEAGERTARRADGKTYMVPDDMSYPEWKSKHARGDKADPPTPVPAAITPEPPKATVPDTPLRMQASEAELDAHYSSIVAAEPDVTAAVTRIVEENGGEMAGLEFRIKTQDSYMRKVASDFAADVEINPDLLPIDVARSINDVLRYTAIAGPEEYYTLYSATILALINEGHSVKKVKNTWNDSNNPYNGINGILVTMEGVSYELQFHTPESFEMKQHKIHVYYEEYRLPSTPKQRKMELWQLMLALAEGIRKPPDVEKIK
jgi:SPP1 gp7 family putative phage head morphogenesis protein